MCEYFVLPNSGIFITAITDYIKEFNNTDLCTLLSGTEENRFPLVHGIFSCSSCHLVNSSTKTPLLMDTLFKARLEVEIWRNLQFVQYPFLLWETICFSSSNPSLTYFYSEFPPKTVWPEQLTFFIGCIYWTLENIKGCLFPYLFISCALIGVE